MAKNQAKWVFVSPNWEDMREDGPLPMDVSWHNVNVYLKRRFCKTIGSCCFNKRKPLHIIKDVSGTAKSGTLLAIMGASGSGKTTLLNVLTGRNLKDLDVKGFVMLNGQASSVDKITACSAYVQQDDIFIGVLTVREHLTFQASLRMKPETKKQDIDRRVNEVLLELGLDKCADSVIGTPGYKKAISSGEKKRLAFASEILTNPSILFADEPTSGLDSFMARNVISLLKSMANLQRTIIMTIHQPSSEIFEMIDQLLLLTEGRVAFMGSTSEAFSFYSSLGLRCPSHYNPADHYIQKLAIIPGYEAESRKLISMICDRFNNSEYAQKISEKSDKLCAASIESFSCKSCGSSYRLGLWKEFKIVFGRAFLCNLRENSFTSSQTLQTVFISLIIGLIYFNQKITQEGIMNIVGALFMILINNTLTPAISVMNIFSHELPVFVREHNDKLYRLYTYYISKTLAELPFHIFLPFISLSIAYYMINLNQSIDRFAICVGCIISVYNVSTGFGYFISSISSSLNVALSLAPSLITPLLIFAGLPINLRSVPYYMSWIKYLSWPFYGNEILVVNQWKGIANISCPFLNVPPQSPNRPPYPTSIRSPQVVDCIVDGERVINKFDFGVSNVKFDFMMLGLLIVIFRIAALIALYNRSRIMR